MARIVLSTRGMVKASRAVLFVCFGVLGLLAMVAPRAADTVPFGPSEEVDRIWVEGRGLSRDGRDLLKILARAREEGLDPDDYALPELEALVHRLGQGEAVAQDVEVAFAAALLRYADDRVHGRVRVADVHRTWEPADLALPVPALVGEMIRGGRFAADLDRLDPPYPEFVALREALYQLLHTDPWPFVPDGPALAVGSVSEIARLDAIAGRIAVDDREALDLTWVEGPLVPGLALVSPELGEAIARFQTRNGISADGILGRRTIAALQQTPEERAEIVALNLDRWRWMPRTLPEREVRVNVPAFELEAFEHGHPVLFMKVIVGKTDWRTPPFQDQVEGVLLNPPWHVPQSIVVDELAPRAEADPDALRAFDIYEIVDGGRVVVDPDEIDWSSADPKRLRLMQRAGIDNALGGMKVELGNDLGIYLHDTPNHEVFRASYRALSHGCVRVERPLDLASWILNRPIEELEALQATGKTRRLPVLERVDVRIGYWTAWVDREGTLRFAPDLYGYDAKVERMAQL